MSGQLEVHHSALCTAPVSLNLCCRGPYAQPGHSPREALTLRPILLWQLRSSRSNAKRYCDVYTVTLYSCLFQQQGYVCRAREGWKGEMTLGERSEEGKMEGGGYRRRKKEKKKSKEDPFLHRPPLIPCHPPASPPVPSQFCWSSTNLGVCFWGSCCVWWQCWRSPPPPRPLSPPGPHWRTWRWSRSSSRRSARASLCLHVRYTGTNISMSRSHKYYLTVKLQAKKVCNIM